MTTEFRLPIRVYIEDTDAGGIVYYVNYLKYMERSRTEYLRNMGYGKTAIFSDDLMFVVHSAQVKYLASARLDDEVVATAKPVKVGRANVVFEQKVFRDDVLLCEGEVRIACVSIATGQPEPMPDTMFTQLGALLS